MGMLERTSRAATQASGSRGDRSHDYKRNGTSSLLAALDTANGKVIGSLHSRHRAIEFKKFLILIDTHVPEHLDVHLVLDNYATHKTRQIKRWLAAHPRFHLHFTPTSGSWLNLIERWFGELTSRVLRRGTHRTVRELNTDIRKWIANWKRTPAHTCGPRPLIRSWTASPHIAHESLTQDTSVVMH
jgi:transposase